MGSTKLTCKRIFWTQRRLYRGLASILLGVLIAVPAQANDQLDAAKSVVLPVFEAFEQAQLENAAHQTTSLRSRLIALGRLDSAGRDVMEKTDLSHLPADQQQIVADAAWAEIRIHDDNNQRVLNELMPRQGWFDQREIGRDAAKAAWLVVQHATNNHAFMVNALTRMKEALGTGRVNDALYAELLDRVEMEQHEPQTYGTQFVCQGRHWLLYKLREPQTVNERRKAVGIVEPLSQDVAEFASMPPCIVPNP